jgi:pimeloyl-ACP methyl ester carboxylesterase
VAFTHNGTTRLWWDEEGSGDPVLLVMGFSYPAQMWHRVWPALTDQFRVIRFDNRGVGQSDVPKASYSIADMADDAFAVLDAAGVERAHVYGASMGGGIAQEMALRHPERVASLVLGCTAAPGDSGGKPRRIPWYVRLIPPRIIISRRAGRNYGDDVPAEAIAADQAILRTSKRSARGLIGQAQAVAAYSSKDRVPSITAPTLVLHGDLDSTVPVEMGKELASLIPGARLEIIQGARHNFITSIDCPANRFVKEFWQSLPSP